MNLSRFLLTFTFLWIAIGCSTQAIRPQEPLSLQEGQSKPVVPPIDFEIPALNQDEKPVKHTGFVVLFDKKKRIPRWVAYHLNNTTALTKVAVRSNKFRVDPAVQGCPKPTAYEYSGYDRGHLMPAEDARWSSQAMMDSFLMSNMTPQSSNLNRGIWKRLEEQVRDWSSRYDDVYVIAGPVLTEPCLKNIGKDICVPRHHYKVILERTGGKMKAIGFVMPQDAKGDLSKYAKSVKDIQKLTGIDFFPSLSKEEADRVESNSHLEEFK